MFYMHLRGSFYSCVIETSHTEISTEEIMAEGDLYLTQKGSSRLLPTFSSKSHPSFKKKVIITNKKYLSLMKTYHILEFSQLTNYST
jgi:hypothetical protein